MKSKLFKCKDKLGLYYTHLYMLGLSKKYQPQYNEWIGRSQTIRYNMWFHFTL